MNKKRYWIQFFTLVIIASIIYVSPISRNPVGNSLVANANPPPPTPTSYPTPSNPQFVNVINLPLIMSAPPPAPAAALSRYMGTINSTVYTNLGCLQAQTGLQDAVVILDFGNPRKDGSPITYGTYLMNYTQNIPATINDIEAASKAFLTGYHTCHISGTQITLAIGTKNEGPAVSSDHGIQWAQMIIRIDSFISSPPSWSDHEAVVGAIDIEMPWNNSTVTKNWVNGYDSVAGRKLYYNFGTCDSCPNKYYDWIPANNWTNDDIWYVSYGLLSAYTIPEIYDSYLDGINASQWQKIKEHGITCTNNCLPSQYPYSTHRSMLFLGSLTQYDACYDDVNNPVGAPACRADGLDNTPSHGWQLFWTELNRDPGVTKQSLRWSTDMSWKNQ